MIELPFGYAGDTNGIFYWIGTNGRIARYVNPFRAGLIKITCSSVPTRYTKPEALVGRAFVTSNFTVGKPPWWSVDLGEGHLLCCNHYSFQSDGSSNYPRHWVLQGNSIVQP